MADTCEGETYYTRLRRELGVALAERDTLRIAMRDALDALGRGDAQAAAAGLTGALDVLQASAFLTEMILGSQP